MSTTLTNIIFSNLPTLLDKVNKQLETTKKPLQQVIPLLLKSGNLKLADTRRLLCVQELCELASGDDTFCSQLLEQCAKQLASADDADKQYRLRVNLALNLYHSNNPAVSKPTTIESFRLALWNHVPLAILLSTVRAGKVLVTQDTQTRRAVRKTLEAAVRQKLTLVSPEFRALISQPTFLQSVQDDEDGDSDEEENSDEEEEEQTAKVNPDTLYDLLLALYRLHFLVSDPLHIDILLRLKLRSAHDVAVLSRGTFLSIIEGENKKAKALLEAEPNAAVVVMNKPAGIRLHDHATAIDCRNQETWVRILDSLKQDFQGIDGQAPKHKASNEKKIERKTTEKAEEADETDRLLAQRHYNMTEIFDLESSPCDECCSVISPSAYLVDLLNFLKACVLETPVPESKPGENGGMKAIESSKPSSVDDVVSPSSSTLSSSAPGQTEATKAPSNLLELLSLRRPDLKHLELSCANSTVMLPYIAIVNEVLESFISSEGGSPDTPAVLAVNCSQDASPHEPSTFQAASTAPAAAVSPLSNKQLNSAMFPLDVFPYSRSRHAINVFLNALGLSYGDILSTFRSEARIVSALRDSGRTQAGSSDDGGVTGALLADAATVWKRAAAAETLGLQALDVAAIARDTIYTSDLIQLAVGTRGKQTGISNRAIIDGVKVPEVWQNWGYASLDAMTDEDEDQASGLCFVRGQFLPRSGLSFAELLELLDSLFFGRRLVLTNATRSKHFSGQISEMRLQVLDLADSQDSEKRAVGPLTAQMCHELQAFIRLKQRLGWSVHELDTALSAILENHAFTSIASDVTEGFSVKVLMDLAHIVTLSDLTQIGVQSLLPLWTEGISTHGGSRSLYARTFQDPGMVMAGDDVFQPTQMEGSSDGLRYFDRMALLSDHKTALMTTLRRSSHELECLVKAAGIKDDRTQLSMRLVGTLYRHSVMCEVLRATPAEYLDVLALFPNGIDLFQDPQTTLEFSQSWHKLLNSEWSTAEILSSVTSHSRFLSKDTMNEALAVTSGLIEKLDGLDELWMPRLRHKTIRDQDVADICVQLFDGPTARVVSAFIEGTQVTSVAAKLTSPEGAAFMSLGSLPSNLTLSVAALDSDGTATLTLKGVLSEETRSFLLVNKSNAPQLQSLIQDLETKSLTGYKALCDRLSLGENSSIAALFKLDIRHDTKGENEADDLIVTDRTRHRRRAAFFQAAFPTLRAQYTKDAMIRGIETAVGGGIEPPILSLLATSPLLTLPENEEQKTSAMDSLCKLFPFRASEFIKVDKMHAAKNKSTKEEDDDDDEQDETDDEEEEEEVGEKTEMRAVVEEPKETPVLQAFFCPAATNSYRFIIESPVPEGKSAAPSFSVNGIAVPMTKTAGENTWESTSIMMATGQSYTITSSVQLNGGTNAFWRTAESAQVPFTSKTIIPCITVSAVASALSKVVDVARLVKKLDFGLEELKYFVTSSSSLIQLNLQQPSLSSLCSLETYRALRESSTLDGRRGAIIDLLAWLNNPTGEQTLDALSSRIAVATRWDQEKVKTAIELKYTNIPTVGIVACFRNVDNLLSLKAALDLSQRIALTPSQSKLGSSVPQPLQILFQIAVPSVPGQSNAATDPDAESAANLQTCLGDGPAVIQCINDMREAQRTALVAFLLQQPYVRKLGIADADGLFGHILMDVQIGAQLEITRTKAAISTIQLFVQRCLLGVEKGAAMVSIDRDKWAWMSRHNLWQATRKAFLYPENWIEPSLRDDKTPQFDTLEQALLSKDLSWKSFTTAMRQYVQELQTISDLDITAYLREDVPPTAATDRFYLFGRTRSSPYTFYHRLVEMTRAEIPRAWWSPWTKINTDAVTHQADWDGTSLRNGSGSYLVPIMRNNRLFLYIPQIMTRPLSSAGGGKDEPKSFQDLAKTKPPTGAGPCNWEIRMAWTELVDGVWTPKRVSEGQLVVDWDGPPALIVSETQTPAPAVPGGEKGEPEWKGLPSIASFIFTSETTGSDVTIQVAYHRPNSDGSHGFRFVGRFLVSEERIVAVKDTTSDAGNTQFKVSMPTLFHKYRWRAIKDPAAPKDDKIATPPDSTYSYSLKTNASPLLGFPKRDFDRTLTWTMSFSSAALSLSHASGLVVDEQKDGDDSADGRSIFMYPRKTDPTIDSSNLWKTSRSEIIEHPSARKLMEAVCQRDEFTSLDMLFDELDGSLVENTDWGKDVVESDKSNYHELATSYALYNWELGLHAVLLAVNRFYTTQQFELALRAARLVFDPTVKPPPTAKTAAERAAACWKFRPFRDMATEKTRIVDTFFKGWPKDTNLRAAVTERRNNPSGAHATARGRPQAYMKWIVMKYVEILVAAGDEYFRQGSMETLPLAIQRYVEAAHVIGPDPPTVPRLTKAAVRTYDTVGDIGKTAELELRFPFISAVERRGSEKSGADSQQTVLGLLNTTYFGLPPNPKYASVRTLVKDRLFKARNNLDINGRPMVYAMAETAIDPALLMGGGGSGGGLSAGGVASLLNDIDCPMPYQRFSVLLSKALDLCAELHAMGDQFFSAREKRDAEAFSLLKASQDTIRNKNLVEIKSLQRHDIVKTIESLQINRDAAVAHLKYLLQLTGDPLDKVPDSEAKPWQDIDQNIHTPTSDDLRMSPFEQGEMIAAGVATGLKTVAMGMETVVGVLRAIPEVTSNAQPMGCGVTIKADATNVARITKGIMGGLKIGSAISADVGTALGRAGALTRQLQERRMQANAKGREIKSIDKQIEIQRARLTLHASELAMQQNEAAHATETEAWLRSKYTNDRLYAWLEGQLRTLHFDLYSLAADMCRRAERAFRFERGARTNMSFLRAGGYWDSSRDGMLAAQQLSLDLRRMEAAFLGSPAHDVELSKNISLRQIDPHALITLREKGVVSFSLPEMLFDLDFPGHYMRRIQSVAVSIPCIVGPHASVAATLSLTQHSYRVSAAASTKEEYLAGSMSNGSFRTDSIPITAVATSSGIQDTGSFDLAFAGPTSIQSYGPFEGAGAVSSWRLELPPPETRPVDYNTISDVVLHLRYTAVDGGPMLKRAASNAVTALRKKAEALGSCDGFWGFIEARHDLSGEWHAFQSKLSQKEVKRTASLDLSRLATRLPFWARRRDVRIESLTVAITTTDTTIGTSLGIEALGTTKDAAGKVQQKWSPTSIGDLKLLTRDNLSRGNISFDDAGWTLTVDKEAGQQCQITDMALYYRYFMVDPPKTTKKTGV